MLNRILGELGIAKGFDDYEPLTGKEQRCW